MGGITTPPPFYRTGRFSSRAATTTKASKAYYPPDAEVYDPQQGTFASAGTMNRVLYNHTATLLLDGHALIVGGYANLGAMKAVELY